MDIVIVIVCVAEETSLLFVKHRKWENVENNTLEIIFKLHPYSRIMINLLKYCVLFFSMSNKVGINDLELRH